MEGKTDDQSVVAIARPSAVILISRLIIVEIGALLVYSLVKIPQIIFSLELGTLLQTTNLISWLLILLLSIGQMVIVTMTVLAWANEYYMIRSGSIIHHLGVFKTVEEEYSLRNIEALTLEQSFWQKMYNYGTIHFFSPVLKQEYFLTNISNPKQTRDLIDQVVNSNKSGQKEKIIFRR